MSVPTGAIFAATAGATAAAAAAAKMRKEEEDMTGYNINDLDGWEFKIMRANTARFKSHQAVQQVCEEEAKAGWEMVEKFDNSRIRFKRKVNQRKNDQFLDFDPYRTHVGMAAGKVAAIVIGSILLIALILAGVLLAVNTGFTPQGSLIMVVLGAMLIIGIVARILRRPSKR